MGLDARFDAAFLGPMAENVALLEELVIDAIRDHAYWRRNFHADDPPSIPEASRYGPERQAVVSSTRHVLRRLAAALKHSVPWYSPRYIGHMSSDLLIPGVVARLLATLYNPNNVSEDASGAMVRLELEVGDQLATMVGYRVDEDAPVRGWGHLTSGGTVANMEALWNHRAARLAPLALAAATRAVGLTTPVDPTLGVSIEQADPWRLANLTVDDALALQRRIQGEAHRRGGAALLRDLHDAADEATVASLGMAAFLQRHGLATPIVVVPHSAHYSWSRAVKLLGLGSAALRHVDVDAHMRLDRDALDRVLDAAALSREPVLTVVGVLGTTEFGTLDPVDALVDARDTRARAGQGMAVHVDAAWGGYLATMFRDPEGALRPRDEIRAQFRYFPSEPVYRAFEALGRTDSMTIDPHKLGFVPYPAGAFVARNREVATLLAESAPYVFVDADQPGAPQIDFGQLGRFILEGSKPGASAASVWATHQVFPLHDKGFGALIANTIDASETLHDAIDELAASLDGVATLIMPFEPDSNIVCLAGNPAGNADAATMNRFMRALYDTMRFQSDGVPHSLEFIASVTSVATSRLTDERVAQLAARLGLDSATFVGDDAQVVMLRHTLMNPWLLRGDPSPLDRYVAFLDHTVRRLCADVVGGVGGRSCDASPRVPLAGPLRRRTP